MFHSSVMLLWSCLAFVVALGFLTADLVAPRGITLVLSTLFGFALLIGAKKGGVLQLCGCIVFAAAIAAVRMFLMPQYPDAIHFTTLEEGRVGKVVREPHIKQEEQEVVIRSDDVVGDILLKSPLQPRFELHDFVTFRCELQAPKRTDEFAYDKYLARHHISSLCYRPEIISITPQNTPMKQFFEWKRKGKEKLQQVIVAPENGILLGVLFGIDDALPLDLSDAFRRVGATHLLVISGSNVVLLSSLALSLFPFLPVSKSKAVLITIGVLGGYAVLTGLQPPAVRATVFGGIALFAMLLGRRSDALRLLVIVATLMLVTNPLLLFYDAGFQLSFLATAGMILFVPFFTSLIEGVPDVFQLRSVIATTLSALLATTPLILHSFGLLSIVALPANIILVPLMNIVMIGGVITLLIAVLIPASIATWICLPMYYVLRLMIDIVEWWAQFSWASVEVHGVSLTLMAVMYVLMGLLAYHVYEK